MFEEKQSMDGGQGTVPPSRELSSRGIWGRSEVCEALEEATLKQHAEPGVGSPCQASRAPQFKQVNQLTQICIIKES